MRLNANFSERVVVRPEDYRWVDSPSPGVERMMLDRVGDEVARATSLVRFAPNSKFAEHVHGGGEEFLVIEGAFGDEHRRYPAGTYVRNPIGSRHTPQIGDDGCLIFVKLHQFDDDDESTVVVNTNDAEWSVQFAPGFDAIQLHQHEQEYVFLIRWAPNTPYKEHTHHGGEEVFVLEGKFCDEYGEYPAGTWVRYPDQSSHNAFTGDEGAVLYLKAGHLPPRLSGDEPE